MKKKAFPAAHKVLKETGIHVQLADKYKNVLDIKGIRTHPSVAIRPPNHGGDDPKDPTEIKASVTPHQKGGWIFYGFAVPNEAGVHKLVFTTNGDSALETSLDLTVEPGNPVQYRLFGWPEGSILPDGDLHCIHGQTLAYPLAISVHDKYGNPVVRNFLRFAINLVLVSVVSLDSLRTRERKSLLLWIFRSQSRWNVPPRGNLKQSCRQMMMVLWTLVLTSFRC